MRVISGVYKGRILDAVEGWQTRPTADKVKESLFNIIGPYFEADTAADLFSGSGSLGIEAVSRGVKHAYLVDSNREAVEKIKENVASLQAEDNFTVLHQTAESALDYFASQGIQINLLFLDPPYDMDVIPDILEQALNRQVLSPRAIVVCETVKQIELPDQVMSLEKIREQRYGKTRLTIFQNTESLGDES